MVAMMLLIFRKCCIVFSILLFFAKLHLVFYKIVLIKKSVVCKSVYLLLNSYFIPENWRQMLLAEAYSKPSQTSRMELFSENS